MPVPMVMETRAMLLGSVPRYLYKAKKNTHQCNKFTGESHRKRSLATWHRNERRRFPRWWSVWSQWLVCLCPAGAAQGYTAREPASTSTQTASYTRSIYTHHEKIYKGWQKERPYRHDDISCLTRLDFQAVSFHWELLKNIQKKLHTNHLIIERSKIQQIHRHFPIAYVTIVMELSGCTG